MRITDIRSLLRNGRWALNVACACGRAAICV